MSKVLHGIFNPEEEIDSKTSYFSFMVVVLTEVACFDSDLWSYYAPVPRVAVEELIADGNRRMQCTINGKLSIHCALMPQHGDFFILLNKEVRHKLGLRLGEQIELSLQKDESEYGMPVPDELLEVFGQDPSAFDIFEKLTPGKQRSLIYLVAKVKNTDSRIRKSLAIAQHLNESQGQLDYKMLNETIKAFNSM
ncbi:MAG: YdeI/OmpD-associated family protein [Bacteroidia bacterium]